MSRYVSFGVLIAVLLLLSIIFYQVMSAFILPLFLAAVLVVIFRPVHLWMIKKCQARIRLASGLTTAIIGLAVIAPIVIASLISLGEARQFFKGLTASGIEQHVKRIRKSLHLQIPAAEELHGVDDEVRSLDIRNLEEFSSARKKLNDIQEAAHKLGLALGILPESPPSKSLNNENQWSLSHQQKWEAFLLSLEQSRNLQAELTGELQTTKPLFPAGETQSESGLREDVPIDKTKETGTGSKPDRADAEKTQAKKIRSQYRVALQNVVNSYHQFRLLYLGGQLNAFLKEIVNPTPAEFEKYNNSLVDWISTNFLSLGGRASQFLFSLVFSGLIMMVAVYFFLADGSKMIQTIKFLSPIEDHHEDELFLEFEKVSRAVVVATLITALVQGLLAGIGYYLAGVHAIFLLVMLTTLLALVPFVGAGAVWIPTCFYLYLIENQVGAAIFLAIWGTAVVSTIDNFLKPWILHGQSNIHPLFALLSVLGGVSVLGPIGILVGPMLVAFLQTLLKILQSELTALDGEQTSGTETTTHPTTLKTDADSPVPSTTNAEGDALGLDNAGSKPNQPTPPAKKKPNRPQE